MNDPGQNTAGAPPVILFPPLAPETRQTLDSLPGLIDRVFPIPGRFRPALPRDVAELSRLLTNSRGDRGASYLGKANLLSAYLRYFLPWNLYRLCRLLPALSLSFDGGDVITDLGAGPLTLAAALWICRPQLRDLALEFRCVDRTPAVLEAGKKFFAALSGGNSPWTVKTIKTTMGSRSGPPHVYGPPARLVSAVNFFNELYEDIPQTDSAGLRGFADKNARMIASLAAEKGSVLVVEPGVPRAGKFITGLRRSLSALGRKPAAPCPHAGTCPFPGGKEPGGKSGGPVKNRWCHFAFETGDAPPALLKLSAAAGIPKERAVLSFLLAGPVSSGLNGEAPAASPLSAVRIISDPFPVSPGTPGPAFGRYGCCEKGLVLVRGNQQAINQCGSGTLVELPVKTPAKQDPKSGALILDLE
jgi:hypothetical protein